MPCYKPSTYYPPLDLYEVASCNLTVATFLTCFCTLDFGTYKLLILMTSVSGNLVLDSHGTFNAYLCHVLNINLGITDLKVVFLLIFVLSGGDAFLPDLCIQLYLFSKSFVIFSVHLMELCKSKLTSTRTADIQKTRITGYLRLVIQSNGLTGHLKSRKGLNGSPFLLLPKHLLTLESHMQLLANGAGET
jgi:hypothetical protein